MANGNRQQLPGEVRPVKGQFVINRARVVSDLKEAVKAGAKLVIPIPGGIGVIAVTSGDGPRKKPKP